MKIQRLYEDRGLLNEPPTNNIMLEDRGQTDLRNFVCELLNRICHSTLNHTHYEIHHKDFCHDNYDPRNLVLLPTYKVVSSLPSKKGFKKPNTSVHSSLPKFDLSNKMDFNKYLSIIPNYSAIDVYRSIRQQSIVYLDNKMLARDLNVATKNPTGRIR